MLVHLLVIGLQAAFQALKFGAKYLAQFAQLDTGDKAFRLKRQLEAQGLNDPTFGGRGNNWAAMLEVLRSKFRSQFLCKEGPAASTAVIEPGHLACRVSLAPGAFLDCFEVLPRHCFGHCFAKHSGCFPAGAQQRCWPGWRLV